MSQQLIVCPFCETQQPNAWDCTSCGRPLHDRPQVAPVQIEAIDGLEATSLGSGGNVAVGGVEGLETTAQADSSKIPAPSAPFEGLDPTAMVDSRTLATTPAPLEGHEPTRIEDVPDVRAPITSVACRYCGTPWQPGTSELCSRCGMRLPIPASLKAAKAAAAPARRGAELARVNCDACGARNQVQGQMCASCGQWVRAHGAEG